MISNVRFHLVTLRVSSRNGVWDWSLAECKGVRSLFIIHWAWYKWTLPLKVFFWQKVKIWELRIPIKYFQLGTHCAIYFVASYSKIFWHRPTKKFHYKPKSITNLFTFCVASISRRKNPTTQNNIYIKCSPLWWQTPQRIEHMKLFLPSISSAKRWSREQDTFISSYQLFFDKSCLKLLEKIFLHSKCFCRLFVSTAENERSHKTT